MKIISLKNKPIKIKFAMIGALLLPSMYLVDLILSRRPDHIIFVLDSWSQQFNATDRISGCTILTNV